MRGVLIVGLLSLGSLRAQTPEPISTGPTSYGWPGTTTATNPLLGGGLPPAGEAVPAPYVLPPTPTTLLETPPSAFVTGQCEPAYDQFTTPNGLAPIPGSLEDQFNHELAARRSFRYCTWNGTRVTGFPNTLLWTPPLAELRAPRMSVTFTNLKNFRNDYTLDNSIGGTLGLVRAVPTGRDAAAQLDLFAVVHSRLDPEDLVATDYRFGFPVTFRRGDWQARIAYEHTSAHVGDEFARDAGRAVGRFARDEVVFGVGRFLFQQQLRLYGTVSYAFFQDLVPRPDPWRFDAGFQWICPYSTGFAGAPFVAGHIESSGAVKYNPNIVGQVGWVFINPLERLAQLRFFAQYYEGRSQFGQLYLEREKFIAVGMAADF